MSGQNTDPTLLQVAQELLDVVKGLEAPPAAAPAATTEPPVTEPAAAPAAAPAAEPVVATTEGTEALKSLEELDIQSILTKAVDEGAILRANEVFEEMFDITRDAVSGAHKRIEDVDAKVTLVAKSIGVLAKALSEVAKAIDTNKTAAPAAPAGDGKVLGNGAQVIAKSVDAPAGGATETVDSIGKERLAKALQQRLITNEQFARFKRGDESAIPADVLTKVKGL